MLQFSRLQTWVNILAQEWEPKYSTPLLFIESRTESWHQKQTKDSHLVFFFFFFSSCAMRVYKDFTWPCFLITCVSLPRISGFIESSVVFPPLSTAVFDSSPPPSLCLFPSPSLCTACVSVPLPPRLPLPCYSISGIYLSYIISAALLCAASPSHLCALSLLLPVSLVHSFFPWYWSAF